MLFLLAAIALTNGQQAQHDRTEWAIYQRMHAEENTIADIWQPSARLLSDYAKVRSCYVKVHLYRAADCNAELAQVDRDLGEVEVARAKEQ